ncbi:LOW QUALITY PROTEIN: Dynein heavy chain, partial [Phytophthora palmivora]
MPFALVNWRQTFFEISRQPSAKDEWGKADVDLKNEFMTESEKFANDLKEALNSMDSGLELRRPDRSIIAETVNNAGHANETRALHIADSPKLIQHYEEVLKEWCDVISTYLETNTTNDGKGNNEQTTDDDGPMGELEYWRRRMQRLTSITEQLKMNEYKDVFAVLSRTTKSVNDDTKQRIQTLLRRWKQIDIGITEAANEAKDNVKYLFTLEKFIIPLYNGTPSSIIDTLLALMNSIKMIHSIARYNNTTERMANLFTKITNQMITNCKLMMIRSNTLLRRWKQIDIGITEAANEAKDNVKYLFTLEKFIIPLYNGTPSSIIDTLPALMNSIKMIHSIARYYNTTERMANLFTKITNQMITNCKHCVTGGETYEVMWDKDPEELVRHLDSCLKLNEAYQQQYRVTKDKLFATPKGKQFEFNEMKIFGKFDLFCRRVMKLIDMFTTIHQFSSLGQHRLDPRVEP